MLEACTVRKTRNETTAILNDDDPSGVAVARYECHDVPAGVPEVALSNTGGATIPHTFGEVRCG